MSKMIGAEVTANQAIRAIREELGLSQGEVARRMGWTAKRYHGLENQEPEVTLRTLRIVARGLGVDLQEILARVR